MDFNEYLTRNKISAGCGSRYLYYHRATQEGRFQTTFLTKGLVIKECDVPESNRTVAGIELTQSVPRTISRASWASFSLTWFRCPLVCATVFRGAGFLDAVCACPWVGFGAVFLLEHSREKCPSWPQVKHPVVLGRSAVVFPPLVR
jgi:hypothetical protein